MPIKDKIKIPREYIDFYITNKDPNYNFIIDEEIGLSEVHISREASSILLYLFLKYYANDEQKNIIREILQIPEKNRKIEQTKVIEAQNNVITNQTHQISTIEPRESIFKKISNFIRKLFRKK